MTERLILIMNICIVSSIIILMPFVAYVFYENIIAEVITVTKVVDGDTFVTDKKQRVRVLRLDTPELNKRKKKAPELCAIEAKEFAQELLIDKTIKLDDKIVYDRYGRRLSSVKLDDGRDYTDVMTKAGFNKLKKKAMRPDCITKIIL